MILSVINPRFAGSLICLSALVGACLSAAPETDVPPSIAIWPNGAPGSQGRINEEFIFPVTPSHNYYSIRGIHQPSLTPFLPAKEKASGVAVIVCPGGGPRELAIEHEGWNAARWLAERGVAAFVLKSRLAREPGANYKLNVEELADAQRAIRFVRSHAKEWNVNPATVGMLGFSAGGRMAYLTSTLGDGGNPGATDPVEIKSSRPDFQALLYPLGIVLPEQNQGGDAANPAQPCPSKDSPPAFLAAGADDKIAEVLPKLYLAFRKAGVPVELHLYARTGHGFGVKATNTPPASEWTVQFYQWLVNLGYLKNT